MKLSNAPSEGRVVFHTSRLLLSNAHIVAGSPSSKMRNSFSPSLSRSIIPVSDELSIGVVEYANAVVISV